LASSDSETADVECFVSATDLTPIDGGCELLSAILSIIHTKSTQSRQKRTKHSSESWNPFPSSMPSFVRASQSSTRDLRTLNCDLVFVAVLGFLLLLFILALGRHRKGDKDIWYSPVNALDGSGHDSKKASKLPPPVTARRTHSQSKPQYTQNASAPKRHVSEKRTYTHRPSQSRQPQPQTAYIPERRAHRSRPTERYRPDYYARDASPRR